ncbi:LuxR family transcriptional regulator [Streptomyces sp. NPDC097619]|uniref:helix-turn-helix transcriptional regulator n=1 Tax=Streptomyces sp. NPDC097619 TaxID=3157228 RepID=UPI00331B93DC
MALWHRDDAFARLDMMLKACETGGAGIALVEGPAGCGKSELLQEFAELAVRGGITVLRAAGTPGEQGVGHTLLRRLAAGLPAGALPADGGVPAVHVFEEALRTVAGPSPVVVCVDDLHHADGPSLDYLLELTRSLRRVPLLLVLAQPTGQGPADTAQVRTEILRHPGFSWIRVGRLDQAATGAVLTRHTGTPSAALAAHLHKVTGGNPLLLKALLTEHPVPEAGAREWPAPLPGGPFAEAVTVCLRRTGAEARFLAAALAVLGDEAGAGLVGELVGASAHAVRQALAVLEDTGLTEGHRLRHPAAAAAVLEAVEPDTRALLRWKAARALYRGRAHASVVAGQLLAAEGSPSGVGIVGALGVGGGLGGAPGGEGRGPVGSGGPVVVAGVGADSGEWAVAALREAARQSLLDDDCAYATCCLELARLLAGDRPERREIELQLAAVTWRADPAAAERYLEGPLAAVREGVLPAAPAGWLARLLVSQGRVECASDTLERTAARDGAEAPAVPREDPLRPLFALPPVGGREHAPSTVPAAPGRLRDCGALWAHPGGGPTDLAAVERLLKATPLAHATFDPLGQAVRTLLHADQADRAVVWCQKLQAQTDPVRTPGWFAAFGHLHAEALLRLGDLAGAEREAAAAATAVAGRGSVFLFAPLATEVLALTARGRYEMAARRLELPVPEELFSSVHAIGYLRARGHYYLATHRPQAAVGEFLDAGRLARRWNLDRPRFAPWRTDVAEALLMLGEHRQAERFIAEQLAMPEPRSARVQGISLRLRAALGAPAQRPKVLGRAVEELRKSGDRLELARALADLGRSLQLVGEGTRAGMVTRRAWQLAADCGAAPLCEQILPGQARVAAAGGASGVAGGGGAGGGGGVGGTGVGGVDGGRGAGAGAAMGALSESERRVAALAAYGYTNREISAKLYITMSTVEQHLTRAYKKLNISRRQELPMDLQLEEPVG